MNIGEGSWLVTGGAGYIGSHVVDQLLEQGESVVIYDSLRNGLLTRIQYLEKKHSVSIPIYVEDIRDSDKMDAALNQTRPKGVLHLAALKSVSDSFSQPDEYYEVNTKATENILKLCRKYDVRTFIFSSSAAVYGENSEEGAISETATPHPISPYGKSKLDAEVLVSRFVSESENLGGSLRFFNVIGSESPELADNARDNLVPIIMQKIKNEEALVIFGDDYPTPDGTCVRDYVDVRDIARAHLAMINNRISSEAPINIGTGKGASVLEVIRAVFEVLGKEYPIEIASRRVGDPPSLYADVSLARHLLEFQAQYELSRSLKSVYE